jgi:ribonuclease-3
MIMDFLESRGITIKNNELLLQALTHSSYSNEHGVPSYERLEFLGDAVLELATSEYFYLYSDSKEGEMSKIRASYVCEEALFEYSNAIGLTPHIRVGNGVDQKTQSIVADCFESVLAVIYLEHGFSVAKKYALNIIVPYVEENVKFIIDSKSYLQEMVQMDKGTIEYKIINETGPQNNKTYEVEVYVDNIKYGVGTGRNKKEAEQNAARDAIDKMAG